MYETLPLTSVTQIMSYFSISVLSRSRLVFGTELWSLNLSRQYEWLTLMRQINTANWVPKYLVCVKDTCIWLSSFRDLIYWDVSSEPQIWASHVHDSASSSSIFSNDIWKCKRCDKELTFKFEILPSLFEHHKFNFKIRENKVWQLACPYITAVTGV